MRKLVAFFAALIFTAPCMAQMMQGQEMEVREVRMPGITCSLKRVPLEPDKYTIVAQMKEHLTEQVIEKCLGQMKKAKPSFFFETPQLAMLSFRVHHTNNTVCTKERPYTSPQRYSVAFYEFRLTGKGKEIDECLAGVEEAPERAPQMPEVSERERKERRTPDRPFYDKL